ncbi:hypothetical protein J2T57_001221 [Natronocella acetinitrilica]|uniref:DUF2384 domain-containing protein n=1 Tax=Natronocella acetinitrilica TaxID=414046 RepID=A0AAE3KAX5_9GAMM|nr:hypothetical protein [Natronocella acetinitrilica]MCP1674119.1 hypothetical protein [Natronocella acetinitrilica]
MSIAAPQVEGTGREPIAPSDADLAPNNAQKATALRTAVAILEKWGASTEQTLAILRIARITYSRVKRGEVVSLEDDHLTRVSIVLNIHAGLATVFDNPENVYGFMGMRNHNAFFLGRSPLEIMEQGDFMSALETYRRIAARCGGATPAAGRAAPGSAAGELEVSADPSP